MIFKDHFGCIAGSIVMLVLGASMAVFGAVVSGTPLTYVSFMHSWGAAFVFNFLAAIIFPAGQWANAFCRLCKAAPGTLLSQALNTLVMNGVYVTCVTLGMMTVNVGFNAMYWPAFFQLYTILFIGGYCVAFLTGIVAAKIAGKIVGP